MIPQTLWALFQYLSHLMVVFLSHVPSWNSLCSIMCPSTLVLSPCTSKDPVLSPWHLLIQWVLLKAATGIPKAFDAPEWTNPVPPSPHASLTPSSSNPGGLHLIYFCVSVIIFMYLPGVQDWAQHHRGLPRMEYSLWSSTFTLPSVSACTLQYFWIIKCKLLFQKLKNCYSRSLRTSHSL